MHIDMVALMDCQLEQNYRALTCNISETIQEKIDAAFNNQLPRANYFFCVYTNKLSSHFTCILFFPKLHDEIFLCRAVTPKVNPNSYCQVRLAS